MALSTYLANKVLDHTYLGAAFTQPSEVYVQLHTGDPTAAGTSNVASETTRIEVSSFAAASNKSKASSAQVQWTNIDAGGTSEVISHISLWDAATSGNCLDYGALASNVTVSEGGTLTFASGDIAISRT